MDSNPAPSNKAPSRVKLKPALGRAFTLHSIYRKGPRSFLRFLALISLVSVMLNTPRTFEIEGNEWLFWATYIADCVTLVAFTAEMITKINHMGLISNEKSYLKDKWSRFDAR